MKFKVYFENKDSTMGGHQIVSFWKLVKWLFLGRISPKEKSDRYYIRKVEDSNGHRI